MDFIKASMIVQAQFSDGTDIQITKSSKCRSPAEVTIISHLLKKWGRDLPPFESLFPSATT